MLTQSRVSCYLYEHVSTLVVLSNECQAALRIIHKITEIREGSPTAVPCPCCDFFQHCFRDPPIVPGNPDLNFRIPIHELGGGSQLDKAPCAAIVVSKSSGRCFNTNFDSSHVLCCGTLKLSILQEPNIAHQET